MPILLAELALGLNLDIVTAHIMVRIVWDHLFYLDENNTKCTGLSFVCFLPSIIIRY